MRRSSKRFGFRYDDSKPHTVVFYDMGSTSVKTRCAARPPRAALAAQPLRSWPEPTLRLAVCARSLVTFQSVGTGKGKDKVKDGLVVRAVAWDEGCGSHVIDARLTSRFAKEFDAINEKKLGESVTTKCAPARPSQPSSRRVVCGAQTGSSNLAAPGPWRGCGTRRRR